MTVVGALWRPRPRVVAESENLRAFRMPDGVRVEARCNWLPRAAERPTLVLVHGLTGDARSGYMEGCAAKALRSGTNAVRVALRGSGDSEEASAEVYHAGVWGDLEAIVRELAREGLGPLVLGGFSLGGNLVLRLAGELGAEARGLLAGVAAVSAPVDLARCSRALDHAPGNRLYTRRFVSELHARLVRKSARHPDRFPPTTERPGGLRELDDRFTAPLAGFGDAATYYAECSALPWIGRIAVPALVVHARDDPVVPFDSLRRAEVGGSGCVTLLAPQRGGHNAFVARSPRALARRARRAARTGGAGKASGGRGGPSGSPPGTRPTDAGGSWTEQGRFWAENRIAQFAAAVAAGTG